jgi:hypothetical protein
MPYDLRKWPENVYPKEVRDMPDAHVAIATALHALRTRGPYLEEYGYKNLGKAKGSLWQINFKVIATKRQVRILYAPYHQTIIVFMIHKKSSSQEQQRAYERAADRKRQAERIIGSGGVGIAGLPTLH